MIISKTHLLLIVLAPLLGSIVAGLFGRQVGRKGAQYVTILGVAVSCALSIYVLYQLMAGGASPFNQNIYTFFEVGGYSAHVGFTGLATYIERVTPKLVVHGHQHLNGETQLGSTQIVGVHGHRLLEI